MKPKPASYYNEDYFSGVGGKGYAGPYGWASAPWSGIALSLVRAFGWHLGAKSITDFGCAYGFVLYCMQGAPYGWKTKGYDFSEHVVANHLPYINVELRDFTKKGDYEPADVVLCMDAFEHIAENKIPVFLDNIRRATKMVFVAHVGTSETVDDKPHPEHITMQEKSWWQAKFEENGFRTHVLEPYYKVQVKNNAKGAIGALWAADAFVLEPIEPVLEYPVEAPKTIMGAEAVEYVVNEPFEPGAIKELKNYIQSAQLEVVSA